jgi:hypothetical protein
LATAVRLFAAVVGLSVFGWALVVAADARHDPLPFSGRAQVFVQTVEVPVEVGETPFADSLVDWPEIDRQTECLWEFLLQAGVELTLQTVLAAGDWTDALGGACLVIGEDDE